MKLQNCQRHFLQPADYARWDAFVGASPQRCIYGQSWYLRALQRPFRILVVEEKGMIYAGIVLAKNRGGIYGNPYLGKYLGVYYADFQGNAYNQETKRRRVTELLLQEISALPSFDYFFHPTFSTYLPFYHQQLDNRVRYSYWLDLGNNSLSQIEANFHAKLRSELKFAQQQNYTLTTALDAASFFRLCEKTFVQKSEKFPFTHDFLMNYYQVLTERKAIELIGVCQPNGDLMAGVALLHFAGVSTLILSGFDKEKIKRGANEWLLYQGIIRAKARSKAFDFEGSMLPNIESFYRKFGGEFRPYLQIYKPRFGDAIKTQLRRWYRKFTEPKSNRP